jgi:hypothetical protein
VLVGVIVGDNGMLQPERRENTEKKVREQRGEYQQAHV